MEPHEAANLIQAISRSLRVHPSQFKIDISMTGFNASNTGGTGYVAQNSGGIGFNSSMNDANIQIANNQSHAVLSSELQKYLMKLDEIEAQLRQEQPCTANLQSLAKALYADKWIPNVITAAITIALQNFI